MCNLSVKKSDFSFDFNCEILKSRYCTHKTTYRIGHAYYIVACILYMLHIVNVYAICVCIYLYLSIYIVVYSMVKASVNTYWWFKETSG